jgi:5-methylcytosine-specific restriction endonuclease McrA
VRLSLRYWKADRHQWGPGQTHMIHEDGTKTLCGKRLSECPGRYIPGIEYDCRACAKVLEAREDRQKREQEWKERQRKYDAERAARDREWWRWYSAYLQSPEWARRRAAVLKRARGICESDGFRRATQVHHITYAHVGNEPLFELRAVCDDCHERLTEEDRQRRQTGW